MNVITVAGRTGKDSELRFLPNGDPVLGFSVADDMVGKDKGTIWWECSLFGKRGEALAPYILKGSSLTVSGSVSERKWTDKDGNERKTMSIRVNEVALQGGKQESQEPRPQAKPQAQRAAIGTQGSGFDDMDDVPF